MSMAVSELGELPAPQLTPEVRAYLDGDATVVYEAILRLSRSQARRMGDRHPRRAGVQEA